MKLYYSPGACSLAPHIALNELGLSHSAEKVDLRAKKTETGEDFLGVNSKGYVPTLETKDGTLTEVQVILQYLADKNPAAGLLPKFGDISRYRAMEMLNFIVHGTAQGHRRPVQPGHAGRRQGSDQGPRRGAPRLAGEAAGQVAVFVGRCLLGR